MTDAENILTLIFGKAEEYEAITGRTPEIFMSMDILKILINEISGELVKTDPCGIPRIGEYKLHKTKGVCELYVGFELKFERRKETSDD